jgi:hypothetical protein
MPLHQRSHTTYRFLHFDHGKMAAYNATRFKGIRDSAALDSGCVKKKRRKKQSPKSKGAEPKGKMFFDTSNFSS